MRVSVFVKSLKSDNGKVVVEAANGSSDGPPFVRWTITEIEARDIVIGHMFTLEMTKGHR